MDQTYRFIHDPIYASLEFYFSPRIFSVYEFRYSFMGKSGVRELSLYREMPTLDAFFSLRFHFIIGIMYTFSVVGHCFFLDDLSDFACCSLCKIDANRLFAAHKCSIQQSKY